MQTKVYEAHRRLLDSGSHITAEAIRDILTGEADKPKMILEIFKEHNKGMHALAGKDFALVTYNRYQAALRNVRDLFYTSIRLGI